jgi:ferredoxin
MDSRPGQMSAVAVLLCRQAEQDHVLPRDGSGAVVDHLCERPLDAAAALRSLGADRVVLGLCGRRAPAELLSALRRAGARPFGIEAVTLRGRSEREAAAVVAGAVARLERLVPGERGKQVRTPGPVSRRALFSLSSVLTEAPVAVLEPGDCLGTARCGLCLERCPAHAIDAAGGLPSIDPSACTACGACVPGCPTGALRLAGASTAQIEAQLGALLEGCDKVVFACASADAVAPPGWALIELPSLGLLTPGWILQARARGADVALAPCEGSCCAGAAEVRALADRIAPARDGATTDHHPLRLDEPRATAEAVLVLSSTRASSRIEHAASPLGLFELDEDRCTVCGACTTACPASALELRHGETETALFFDPAACVACRRCVTACPEQAIDVRPGIAFDRLKTGAVALTVAAHERCTVCGTELPPRRMRARVNELLGRPDAPLELCAGCATRAQPCATEYDPPGASL